MSSIVETRATGADVERLIRLKLLPAIADEDRSLILISLMTLTLTLMKPDITGEEIQDGVKGMSEWMCLFLSTGDESELPDHERRILN